MQVHRLKCWPSMFRATKDGLKTAEFRRNDRNYEVGDELVLEEFLPEFAPDGEFDFDVGYSGGQISVKVKHIVRGPDFGIPAGFVMMSVELCDGI